MRYFITFLLAITLLALPLAVFADESGALPTPTEVSCGQAAAMLTQTHAAVSAILNPDTPPLSQSEGTCYIWQQPGVALVITDEWRLDEPLPEIWISADKLRSCFTANLKCERPPLRITEEYAEQHGGIDELEIEPSVYLLDAPAAQERIGIYAEGLETWAGMNEGMDFIMPSAESLAPAGALVYLDSSGPLEFYFIEDADGSLILAHVIFFDFFSA